MAVIRSLNEVNKDISRKQENIDRLRNPLVVMGSNTGSNLALTISLHNDMSRLKGERDAIQKYVSQESNDCKKNDTLIKLLDVDITEKSQEVIGAERERRLYLENYLKVARAFRSKVQSKFISADCARKLEDQKVKETAQIFTDEASKYDKDVLSVSNKQTNTLLLIGGAVLLVATGIILKFNQKK